MYALAADHAFPGSNPLPTVPALPAANDFPAPGGTCVDNPKLPAPTLTAPQSAVFVVHLLSVSFHACFLRCNSAN